METMATMVGRTTDTRLMTHCSAAMTRRGKESGDDEDSEDEGDKDH